MFFIVALVLGKERARRDGTQRKEGYSLAKIYERNYPGSQRSSRVSWTRHLENYFLEKGSPGGRPSNGQPDHLPCVSSLGPPHDEEDDPVFSFDGRPSGLPLASK